MRSTKGLNRWSKKILYTFHKNVDYQRYGKRFYKLPTERRTFFIATPEGLQGNYHHHLLKTVPAQSELFLLYNAELEIQKIIPSATVKIYKLEAETDVRVTSFYSCKDTINSENYNRFVLSKEFSSFKKK